MNQTETMPTPLCECGCGQPAPRAPRTRPGVRKGDFLRFIDRHQNWANSRFAKRGDPTRYVEQDCGYTSPCWVWQGSTATTGYGRFRIEGRAVLAHRWHYERANGPIPDGLQIDHLCRNRACCNPDHLEPVTPRENILRGEGMGARYARRTHCANGHPLSGENLYVRPGGARLCRTCKREARAA